MGRKILKYLIVLSLLLIVTPCFADIEEARNTYNTGDSIGALILYEDWLNKNQKSSEFSNVLFEISELSGNIHAISLIIEKQIGFVIEREERKVLYKRLAQFSELSADLQSAQINYQKAALISLVTIDFEMLLESAKMLILEGELLLAESQLEEIIINSSDQNIAAQGKILFTLLKLLKSDSNIDYKISPLEKPELVYLMYLIAKANSETSIMDKLHEKLVSDFESSPETGLLRNELSALPDIISTFGLLKNDSISGDEVEKFAADIKETNLNYMIQAGSFRDQENAHYLSLDLKKEGFSPIVEEQIVNETKYFKVILYFLSQVQMSETLSLLKEKGFEGFPVY